MTSSNDLSIEETELYDRQIRAWGFEAQKRMRESKILIIGLDGAGSELLKNLVLAGLGNITIVENRPITEDLITTHFYLQSKHLNGNWSQIAFEFFSEMNPNIKLTILNKDINLITSNEYQQFDVIVLNSHSRLLQIKINDICRQQNSNNENVENENKNSDQISNNQNSNQNKTKQIAFFSCRSIGEFGYIFSDLGLNHQYQKNKNETEIITQSWYSLTSAWIVSNTSINKQLKKKASKYRQLLYAFQVCEQFESQLLLLSTNNSKLGNNNIRNIFQSILNSEQTEYQKLFDDCQSQVKKSTQFDATDMNDNFLRSVMRVWNLSVCPANAMLGGYLSNFVMFYVQRIQKPLHNMLLFDMWHCEAMELLMNSESDRSQSQAKKNNIGKQKVQGQILLDSSDEDEQEMHLID